MTERRTAPAAGTLAGAIALLLGGALHAQETGSIADRTRQAFQSAAPTPAQSADAGQAEAEAVARRAAERLEVELISTRLLEVGARRLIAARVMEPGTDSNVAFLVQTLILDPDSGEVLGVFPGTDDEIGALPSIAAGAPVPADEPDSSGAE